MKKVLITGGAGFVGYHLADFLLKNSEAELTLVDNLQRGKMDEDFSKLVENSRVKFLALDLTDPNVYSQFGSGYDHVYHLAAVNGTRLFYEMPHEVLRINTLALVYGLEWFRRENAEGKLLFPSSSEVYAGALHAFGVLPIPTPEEVPLVIPDPYNPRSSYDVTKILSEPFVIHYARKYNFRAVIVRPHNFYGPRAGYGGHVIPDFCERIASKADPFNMSGADDTRTFCYITDAVRAMVMLMASPKTDKQPIETFHIGDTHEIGMRDLAEKMFEITGFHPAKIITKPSPEGSVKRRLADISKLRSTINWKPEMALEEGLKLTYDWYLSHPRTCTPF